MYWYTFKLDILVPHGALGARVGVRFVIPGLPPE